MERKTSIATIIIVAAAIIGIAVPFALEKEYGIKLISLPESIAITLGFIAIIMTIYIASRQDDQLNQLKGIGEQTGETVEKLTTESVISKRIKIFFTHTAENSRKKYKCVFPVDYSKGPLPSISQGDFYAIHIVSSRLGEDNLELIGIGKDEQLKDNQGNLIFICAANAGLQETYKIEKINNEDDMKKLKEWPLNDLNLPCWFIEDLRSGRSIKKIKIYSNFGGDTIEELLESPSEKIYEEMHKQKPGTKYEPLTDIQRDHAIFARLSKDNNQHIIIAGLHQYGTWIVGQLLNNLLCGEKMEYCSIFLDSKDFISIITGEFVHKKLLVAKDSIQVLHRFIWVKEADRWIRITVDEYNES